jgi:hypothetical protein
LKNKIEDQLKQINHIFESVILEPPDIQRILWLKIDLKIQIKQLDLLLSELDQVIYHKTESKCLAKLIILKTPFPLVINKGKQISEDLLQVQLLTSCNQQFQFISQIKTALLCDISHGKGNLSKTLDNDCQNLDINTRIAKFPIKFLSGTKKTAATLKFGIQVTVPGNSFPITIESNTSPPFVVITNECQWEGSAGTLLRKDIFSDDQFQVSWQKFANTLQYHFLKATKQELSQPRRILSNYDLNFIQNKFFNNKTIVSQEDFDEFWKWFGKAMQKIRYQRHICSMWQNGLIYGFMGRDQVNASLKDQEIGTFLIRFSERHSGQFVIAHIGVENHKIKHYLVQPNDTASSKKTLPDFIQECPQFTTLLVLSCDSNGNPSFIKIPKNIALEPYCGKKQELNTENGYDPL